METNLDTREQISALADGELHGDAAAMAFAQLAADTSACETWIHYQLVGEILRGGERAARAADPAFVARVRARLDETALSALPLPALQAVARMPEAANNPAWRWKLAAGFASLAAVAAVAWNLVGPAPGASSAQLAQAASPAAAVQLAAGEPQQVMIRDPRLDELLAAHNRAGGASALQMPAGFLRNATFEGPSR